MLGEPSVAPQSVPHWDAILIL